LEIVSWQAAVFTTDNLRTLQSIASTLAVALENARLYVEQKQLLQEREQAQARLIHSEKMSALGRLAASIAHEINNPLQAIQGCLTLAEEELAGRQRPEKLTRYLGIVSSEFERVASIVRRMRDFYRPMREGRLSTDVHFVLVSVLELANKQLQHSGITVERQWAADLPLIQANPDHLKQVFLNLVLNAIDAMPQGGMLRISTAVDWIHVANNGSGSATPGLPIQAVRIEFNDTGAGMSPEVQSRLFEPFFTSKEHGSGLGLSISYGIIESHNGQIRVQSQEGVGTTFTILLPVGSTSTEEQ
jgi:two-component system NtrC family sensor kinase